MPFSFTKRKFSVEDPFVGDVSSALITPAGNRPVHNALRYLHSPSSGLQFCEQCPVTHLTHANAKRETPLHIAAMTENLQAVRCILRRVCSNEEEVKLMVRMADENGDTALHWALRKGNEEIARELMAIDMEELPDLVNANGESPLYLAASRSLSADFADLLLARRPENHGGPNGLTALHAAVFEGNSVWVDKLLQHREGIAQEADGDGRTPLHHAVLRLDEGMAVKLVEHDYELGYMKDRNGDTAIAIAARKSRSPISVSIFKSIFHRCPDSVGVKNNEGMNPFHVAVEYQNERLMRYICSVKVLQRLINEQDNDGNTPLHLAVLKERLPGFFVEGGFPRCRLINFMINLTFNSAADLRIRNKQGLTAAELFYSFKLPLWLVDGVLWNFLFNTAYGRKVAERHQNAVDEAPEELPFQEMTEKQLGKYLKNVSLIATLMTSVTFAAAFAMPGGYTDEGEAPLVRSAALKAFLVSDAISMCSSLTVAYISTLLATTWSSYYPYVLGLMRVAFGTMLVAFATGMYAVVAPGSLSLGILICVFCVGLGSLLAVRMPAMNVDFGGRRPKPV